MVGMPPPDIVTVMVNWNLKDDTIACVRSLLAAGGGRVVVVDNGSTDGSVGALREAFGAAVTLVESGENLGFTGGVNLGVGRALGMGAAWVLLVNNDTVVADDFFAALSAGMAAAPEFDLYAPSIFYFDAPGRLWFFGDRLIAGTLFTRGLYRNAELPAGLPPAVAVDFVCGCGMLARREVFERAGGFDTSLFMYGEEVDFCWRARLAGFRMAVVPAAKMWHKVSSSAGKDKPRYRYLRVRNQAWFYRRYSRGAQVLLMGAGGSLKAALTGLADLARGDWGLIPPLLRGWRDGWFAALPELTHELGEFNP
jgi:GT2 family glycosyltransferase